jgi:hypothetical protein
MTENSGMKMRIIALDELMKCCTEVGRNMEDDELKALLKALYEAAKTRHEFLAINRSEGDQE